MVVLRTRIEPAGSPVLRVQAGPEPLEGALGLMSAKRAVWFCRGAEIPSQLLTQRLYFNFFVFTVLQCL